MVANILVSKQQQRGSALILLKSSMKLVFCCFSCGHFLFGKQCLKHHAKDCCSFGPPPWHVYNSPAPKTGRNPNHRWISCGSCMRQQSLAGTFDRYFCRLPAVITAPLRWGRFLCLLITKHFNLSVLAISCKNPQMPPFVTHEIGDFLG